MSDPYFKNLLRVCIGMLGFGLSMWVIREMADIYIQLDIAVYINSNDVEPTWEVKESLRNQSLASLVKHLLLLFGGYFVFTKFSKSKPANENT